MTPRDALQVYYLANRSRLSPRRPERPAWVRALPWLAVLALEYEVLLRVRWWPS
jgi:hypothetical protein